MRFDILQRMDDFLRRLAEVLEVPEVRAEDDFRGFDMWDSLTAFAIRVLIEQRYGRKVSAEELKAARTARDLAALAGVAP